jgi:hypothetical protein
MMKFVFIGPPPPPTDAASRVKAGHRTCRQLKFKKTE